jgi:hypothetical protein
MVSCVYLATPIRRKACCETSLAGLAFGFWLGGDDESETFHRTRKAGRRVVRLKTRGERYPMGDSPSIMLLSAVPLLVIAASITATVVAWRSRRRAVRTIVGAFLVVFGAASMFSAVGILFSMAAGALIGMLGLALLVAEYACGART